MALWTNEGLQDKTEFLYGVSVAYSLTLRLFVNAVGVTVNTVYADLVECTLPLYAAVPLLASSWLVATAGGVAQASYPTVTFTFGANSGTTVIYGYMVQNTVTGATAFVEAFTTPYTVPGSGGSLTIQITDLESNPY